MFSQRAVPQAMAIGLWLAISYSASAEELRDTLKDLEVGQRWAYNDWDSAQSAAAKSKKPILALFR